MNRFVAAAALLVLSACKPAPDKLPDMALYADGIDSVRSVITQTGVAIDPAVSTDGRGSLRIDATGERTVVQIADVPLDAPKLPRLAYRAKLRGENVVGRAYLELLVTIDGVGVSTVHALHSQIAGTSEWSTHEAQFLLNDDQEPIRARLNVVVEGAGTVWVDGATLTIGRN